MKTGTEDGEGRRWKSRPRATRSSRSMDHRALAKSRDRGQLSERKGGGGKERERLTAIAVLRRLVCAEKTVVRPACNLWHFDGENVCPLSFVDIPLVNRFRDISCGLLGDTRRGVQGDLSPAGRREIRRKKLSTMFPDSTHHPSPTPSPRQPQRVLRGSR